MNELAPELVSQQDVSALLLAYLIPLPRLKIVKMLLTTLMHTFVPQNDLPSRRWLLDLKK